MDILSDVMSMVRTKGHVYGLMELTGPFGLAFPHQYGICMMVASGGCYLNIERENMVSLQEGDFVFLPTASTFFLRSSPVINTTQAISQEQLLQFQTSRLLTYEGGGDEEVTLISGCFTFASPENHLLMAQLPSLLHIKGDDIGPGARHLINLMQREISQAEAGASGIIDRLVEVLLLKAIRHHFHHLENSSTTGWLRALGDKKIHAALGLMHRDPGFAWTLENVAQEVGMSRSAFALRFKEVVGKTLLDHLTQWRMARAAELIRSTPSMKIDTVAELSGYQSESAFRKAFYKVMQRSPKAYRDMNNE